MPTIELTGNEWGPAMSVDAPEGGRLVDLCDEARAPVLFSCRSASCGVCRVAIIAGAEHLEPPLSDEIEVLEILGAPPAHRLACQAVVRASSGGRVSLRWISDDGDFEAQSAVDGEPRPSR